MIEEIGKIKLNLEHYPGEDLYCDGEIEDELLDIARNYAEVEYPSIIEERKSWPILYHLSSLRENIVEWLPIDKHMKVLEVGSGCGAITGALARKAKEVTCVDLSKKRSMINAYRHMDCDNVTIHVGNFQDIEPDLPCDYDYICLIGVFEYGQAYIESEHPYEDFLHILKKHSKKGGHIAIAIENKLGLKYWAGCKEDHLGTWFSGLEDYPEGGVVRTFTRDGLLKIAEKCGFSEVSMYYPYPDYKFMTCLYSDKRLPKLGELSSNLRNFDRERLQLFDEKLVFDTLIREGQFPLFSNSYMMILGEEPEIKYAKYSNDRVDAFKIKTLLTCRNEGGQVRKQIEKHPLSNESKEHITQIYQNFEKLSKRWTGGKLKVNQCRLIHEADSLNRETGSQKNAEDRICAVMEYLEGRTLEEYLDECLDRGDINKFHALFNEYLERISYQNEDCKDAPVTDYDLIFANILIDSDGEWHIIDYEWTFDKAVETKEIAFRSVYCYMLESGKREKLNLDLILNELNLTESEAEQYREQEMKFQKYVTGKRMSMAEIRDAIGQPVYKITDVPLVSPAERLKERVQIYEDLGGGFLEEHSFFLEDGNSQEVFSEERDFQVTIGSGRKALRIDPCSHYCIVRLKEIKWNDTVIPIKHKRLSTNGTRVGEGVYAFATQDPNITLQLDGLQEQSENLLQVSMLVTKMPKETVEHMQRKGLF